MSYKKVIVSAHRVEVFEMERAPVPKRPDIEDEYNYFLKGSLETEAIRNQAEQMQRKKDLFDGLKKEDRTEERRKQTLRDARNKLQRLALANFDGSCYFITLTVAENSNDIKKYDKEFKDHFLKSMRRHFKDSCTKYLAVREFQKRGAIHYHLMIDAKFDLPEIDFPYNPKNKNDYRVKDYDDRYIKPLELFLHQKCWKHGFVDIKPIAHVDNVGAYLTKYMTKLAENELLLLQGHKAYLSSRGLQQPKEYKGIEAEEYLRDNPLNEQKKVFTNGYESEYNGKILYRDYNLKRN